MQQPAPQRFARLYEGDEEFGHAFAVLHSQLNTHFEEINGRAETTHHYWAEPSRDLIALTLQLQKDLHDLNRLGIPVQLEERYLNGLERCRPWLSRSGGSTVPDDFDPLELVEYEPVFSREEKTITLKKSQTPLELKMIGEGSYANVFSYVDPDYGIRFAVKRAKRGIDPRDLQRFRNEFEVMKRLSFPYVVEVYRYDDAKNEYRMEYCDENLRTYIGSRNNSIAFSSRKRMALQFLYGLNYIHTKGLLHRDLSLQNVLVKSYRDGAVLVKLSDFGLVKEGSSEFTRTQTEMKGTIRDPQLRSFAEYEMPHEIYAVGFLLTFIFTGREVVQPIGTALGDIVARCVSHDSTQRYSSVLEVIEDVERLETHVEDSPA